MKLQKQTYITIAHYRSDIVSGAERSIADLVGQLDRRFRITMLVPDEGKLSDFYRSRGMEVWVRNVNTTRRLFPGLHTLQSYLLARKLKEKCVDLVLSNTFPAALRVGTACKMANLPHAIYMRDYISDTALHRRVLSQSRAVLAISKDVVNHLTGMVPASKIHLAYNYIHPDSILDRYEAYLASGRRLLPFPVDHPVIGLVGRITPYKQPELLIQAIPHVLQAFPQARFAIIGAAQPKEKPYEEQVKLLATELGITDKVAFLGLRKDVIELTSEFTIACLTSSREPLGRVILEAQLLGVPVIVPDAGGPAEIVENEVTGLYFPSNETGSAELLACRVIRLLEDADLRDCLANKARERVLTTFASQKHVRIQESLFEIFADGQPE
jgi:glycosyltransferase involved in cell wall biosynthesis